MDPRSTDRLRRLRWLFLVVACLAAPLPQAQAESRESSTGSIRGTVVYEADRDRPWRLGRYYVRGGKSGMLAESVVAIADRRLRVQRSGETPRTIDIDQKNFQFTPETVAIRAGDSIRFLNSDGQVHNVRTEHARKSLNVNLPAKGEHVEAFPGAGGLSHPYRIGCVFHSSMRAWIYVFDHPWFTTTGTDGGFFFEDVPAGDYQLEVVHPAGDLRARQAVTVRAGETLEVEFVLTPDNLESRSP